VLKGDSSCRINLAPISFTCFVTLTLQVLPYQHDSHAADDTGVPVFIFTTQTKLTHTVVIINYPDI